MKKTEDSIRINEEQEVYGDWSELVDKPFSDLVSELYAEPSKTEFYDWNAKFALVLKESNNIEQTYPKSTANVQCSRKKEDIKLKSSLASIPKSLFIGKNQHNAKTAITSKSLTPFLMPKPTSVWPIRDAEKVRFLGPTPETKYEETLKRTNDWMQTQRSKYTETMLEHWAQELETFEKIHRLAADHHLQIQRKRGKGNVKQDLSSQASIQSRRSTVRMQNIDEARLSEEERISVINTLHCAIRSDYFGLQVGVHRWPLHGEDIGYFWMRIREQLNDINTRRSVRKSRTRSGEQDKRAKAAVFWLVSFRYQVPSEFSELASIDKYLDIPHEAGKKNSSAQEPTDDDTLLSTTINDETETSSVPHKSSRGQGIIKLSAIAALKKTQSHSTYHEASIAASDNINESKQTPFSINQRASRNMSLTESMIKELNLLQEVKEDPEKAMNAKLQEQRTLFPVSAWTANLRAELGILEDENPIPIAKLTREVIKKIPISNANDSDNEEPDLSDCDVDEDLVQAVMKTALLSTPQLGPILLRECVTRLPPHREILPCIDGLNENQRASEKKNKSTDDRFIFAPRMKGIRDGIERFLLTEVIPVAPGATKIQSDESTDESSLSGLSEGAFIERINAKMPSSNVFKSELFGDFIQQSNNSNSAIRRQSSIFRLSEVKHPNTRKKRLSRRSTIRKPHNDDDAAQKAETSGSNTRILFLPNPKPSASSILKMVSLLLDKTEPHLVNMMSKVSLSARPLRSWEQETNEETLGMALTRLSIDLLRYRHEPGNSIRFKALAVVAAGKTNPFLFAQMCLTAAQPGNWLDQMIRASNSQYASCRLEAAIALLGVVTFGRLMKAIWNQGIRPLLYDIMSSLFRTADIFEESFNEFFVVMAFLLQCSHKQILVQCILDRGPAMRSRSIVSNWPYLISFVYTHWSYSTLCAMTISEKRLVSTLDNAWKNPLSRRAALSAMKAIHDYTILRSNFVSRWPLKGPKTPMTN